MCCEIAVSVTFVSCLELRTKPGLKYIMLEENTFTVFKPLSFVLFQVRNRLFATRVPSFTSVAASATYIRHLVLVRTILKYSAEFKF